MNEKLLNNNLKLEILISTMFRVSLDFLETMFPFQELSDLNILIINQTEKGKELRPGLPNIRVINSYEKGISKSRNLAIKNAIGDICLIADDDVEYVPNFENIVKNAFTKFHKASIVLFKIKTFSGKSYKFYPTVSKRMCCKKEVKTTSSIEIAFQREDIQEKFYFNTNFGLGSQFDSGEEYVFLKEVLHQSKEVYFENQTIVKHKERPTSYIGSDNFIKVQAVLYYQDYKELSYLYLFKFVLFLLRKGIISMGELVDKFRVGLVAVINYKKKRKET